MQGDISNIWRETFITKVQVIVNHYIKFNKLKWYICKNTNKVSLKVSKQNICNIWEMNDYVKDIYIKLYENIGILIIK